MADGVGLGRVLPNMYLNRAFSTHKTKKMFHAPNQTHLDEHLHATFGYRETFYFVMQYGEPWIVLDEAHPERETSVERVAAAIAAIDGLTAKVRPGEPGANTQRLFYARLNHRLGAYMAAVRAAIRARIPPGEDAWPVLSDGKHVHTWTTSQIRDHLLQVQGLPPEKADAWVRSLQQNPPSARNKTLALRAGKLYIVEGTPALYYAQQLRAAQPDYEVLGSINAAILSGPLYAGAGGAVATAYAHPAAAGAAGGEVVTAYAQPAASPPRHYSPQRRFSPPLPQPLPQPPLPHFSDDDDGASPPRQVSSPAWRFSPAAASPARVEHARFVDDTPAAAAAAEAEAEAAEAGEAAAAAEAEAARQEAAAQAAEEAAAKALRAAKEAQRAAEEAQRLAAAAEKAVATEKAVAAEAAEEEEEEEAAAEPVRVPTRAEAAAAKKLARIRRELGLPEEEGAATSSADGRSTRARRGTGAAYSYYNHYYY